MKHSFFISRLFFLLFFLAFAFACQENSEPEILPARDLLNISYGTDSRQTMDVFLPAGRSTATTPTLIYIHGGAWIDGDKSEFLQVKSIMEKEFEGFALISLNYRLYDFALNKNLIPDQEKDIESAIAYIKSQLNDWKIADIQVISGASAGGHLALLHAYKRNVSSIKAAIAFFPPTDLSALYGFNNLTSLGLSAVVGGTPSENPEKYREVSPTTHIDSQDVPTIFFHGDVDTVVPITQSELLKAGLEQKNVRHQFTKVPGQGHGFTQATYSTLIAEARAFIGDIN
ncbi:carboxylesterase family protein [Algoriphagus boseongensis]|uniref:Carboxylesterase family protein n=1 Tax=Algoriphagus boseongensis TaxID=1442587 RepID=A0A4R6T1J6_9BACT|nr:alpha/beta hydrolase [Algoriphagus boseongensis]TDQ12964.1 carboxylesterase family protein [Algoriphagus boseongensis]